MLLTLGFETSSISIIYEKTTPVQCIWKWSLAQTQPILSFPSILTWTVVEFQLLFILNSLVWQTELCVLWKQLFSRDFWYFLILVGLEIPQKQLSLWYFGTSTIRTRWYTEVQRKHWIWIMIRFKKSSTLL